MTRQALKARIGLLPLLGLVISAGPVLVAESASDHETDRTRSWVERVRACLVCHSGDRDKAKLLDPALACDANCLRCHKDMDKHHPVGPEVEEKEKVSLPLLSTNKVACISCHDLNTAPSDKRSWKSQSLFARLFQDQQIYKTYYLRINNSNGKLCRTCH